MSLLQKKLFFQPVRLKDPWRVCNLRVLEIRGAFLAGGEPEPRRIGGMGGGAPEDIQYPKA